MAMAVVLARQKPCHSVKIESGAAAYIYITPCFTYGYIPLLVLLVRTPFS